jgi:hypothetical protein
MGKILIGSCGKTSTYPKKDTFTMERAAALGAASHHLKSMAIPFDITGWPFLMKKYLVAGNPLSFCLKL